MPSKYERIGRFVSLHQRGVLLAARIGIAGVSSLASLLATGVANANLSDEWTYAVSIDGQVQSHDYNNGLDGVFGTPDDWLKMILHNDWNTKVGQHEVTVHASDVGNAELQRLNHVPDGSIVEAYGNKYDNTDITGAESLTAKKVEVITDPAGAASYIAQWRNKAYGAIASISALPIGLAGFAYWLARKEAKSKKQG